MVAKFQKHIDLNFPFLKDEKLLLTVSGGIDSVILTHLLHQKNYDISIAHCNFNLRGKESDLDETFVKQLANKLTIPFYTISFKTKTYAKNNKLSTQMAARKLRYAWFEEIRSENNLDTILTAHHADDVLETFLINLTRGTGLEGLTGIPAINGNIIRPFLNISREEIETYAQENNIKWSEDLSNASTKYFRNKIRHQVVPILKELNPNLLDTFKNTLNNLKGSQQLIDETVRNNSEKMLSTNGNILQFNIEEIKKLSAQKTYLFEILKTYNFTEWNDILNLLNAQSGKQVFSKTHRLIKDREYLLLDKIIENNSPSSYTIKNFSSNLSTEDFTLMFELDKKPTSKNNSKTEVCIDFDKIKFPLTLRKWQHGDYFYPAGMKGKKKLSNFFNDEKMSILDKEKAWLLTNSKNEIIWIVGKRLDNRFKVNSTTEKFIQITYSNK